MQNEFRKLSNDPRLLELGRYQPPGCVTQITRGTCGAIFVGTAAIISGTPFESGLGVGFAAGVIIPNIPRTARAIIVDFQLIYKFIQDIRANNDAKK